MKNLSRETLKLASNMNTLLEVNDKHTIPLYHIELAFLQYVEEFVKKVTKDFKEVEGKLVIKGENITTRE